MGCGGAQGCPRLEGPVEKPDIDDDVALLLTDVAHGQVCDLLEGTFVQLSSGPAAGEDQPREGPAPGTGRLWVEECTSDAVRGDLRVEIAGRGWQWIARESRTLGATFEVEQYVMFRARVRVLGEVRPTYDPEARLLQLTLKPTDHVVADLEPIQPVDAEAAGVWGEVLAHAIEALTGEGIDARARESVARRGSQTLRLQLRQGMAFAIDLCSGKRFASVGAMRPGMFPDRPPYLHDNRWITTERVRLHPGGLDIAGPWSTDTDALLHARVAASGGPALVQLLCADEASRLVDAYLAGEPLPEVDTLAEQVVTSGAEARLDAPTGDCDVALAVRPHGDAAGPVTLENVLWSPPPRSPPTRRMFDCPGDEASPQAARLRQSHRATSTSTIAPTTARLTTVYSR